MADIKLTPKQKAKELVEKFSAFVRTPKFGKRRENAYYLAKEVACICVDEILKVYIHMDENVVKRKEDFRPVEEVAFWSKVKEEIQKL